ncbi:MAG: uroporphyrinogen-III C-methyltransferase [Pseudomonadales bacterium]
MSDDKAQSRANGPNVQLNETFQRLEKKTNGRSVTIETSKPPIVGTFLGIFLALIAIGIGSYAVWMVRELPDVAGEIPEVRGQVEAVAERSKARTTRLNAVEGQLDRLRRTRSREIDGIERRVDQAINEIRHSMGPSSEDWLMAEVEYLLRLGNHRVLLQQDPKGAIPLFEAADKIVKDTEGITAFALRKAIASDIAKLESVRKVDVDGIFVKLAALKGLVGDLKQKELGYSSKIDDAGNKPGTPEQGTQAPDQEGVWTQIVAMLEKAGARLAGMIQFRSEGEKIKPVLPPEEEYYLRQNLMLKIQLAQLALLREDNDIFRNSLTEAKQWVTDNFSENDSVTRAVLNDLDEIMDVNIEQEMPDVSSSLREARRLLSSFHQVEDNAGS